MTFPRLSPALAAVLLLARLAAAQPPPIAITGIVQDQTGAVLPGAAIGLVTPGGAVAQSTIADIAGAFRDKVAPGQYELIGRFQGFTAATVKGRAGTRAPGQQKLVLGLADIAQEITVSNRAAQVDAHASNNLAAVTIDQNMLEGLPVFNQDDIATLTRFLDSGSIGTAGVTIVVNGGGRTSFMLSANDEYEDQQAVVESDGRQHTDSLQATVRGKLTRWFNGQVQYTLSRAYNDTNGIASFPANDYDLAGEWARAGFDRRHRFLLLGRASAGRLFDLGLGVTMTSGGPYTESLGGDPYNNAGDRARPAGISRNTLEGAGSSAIDLRASKDLSGNYASYVGTVNSPLFGQPVAARAARQLQASARLRF